MKHGPWTVIPLVGALAGCSSDEGASAPAPEGGEAPAEITNRIAVPPAVRENLGIRFVPVEERAVSRTLRIPGVFEWKPTARTHYHSTLPGRVRLAVEQYQDVSTGDLLASIESPAWQRHQAELVETESRIRLLRRQVAARAQLLEEQRSHKLAVEQALQVALEEVQRLLELKASGGGRANDLAQAHERVARARADLAAVEEEIAGTGLAQVGDEEELEALRDQSPRFFAAATGAEIASEAGVDLLLGPFASLLGLGVDELLAEDGDGVAGWRRLTRVEIRAEADGFVRAIDATDGGWVEAADRLLVVVDPDEVRFHGDALQADLGRIRPELPATVVPPPGVSSDPNDRIPAQLSLGWDSQAHSRVVSVIGRLAEVPAWARPGVAASLELVLEGDEQAELAIPVSCLVRDGLVEYFFRRDGKDPDQVIREQADLGVSDGKWVEIRSGLMLGDEVVLDGAYELGISGLGKAPTGGHFHADGTFHAEDH